METQQDIAEAIRKASDAYVAALSTVTKALESAPQLGGDANRRRVEQGLQLARLSKEGFISTLEQAFDLWERECRRVLGAPHPPAAASWATSPMAAWMDNWRRTVEAFMPAQQPGDAWTQLVRQQAELTQQALQEGLRAWQRLWPSPARKP
jgi:hypothetical protein